MKIAIDGPAGAGKSSVSKSLAKKLGFIYVDTGALYRSLAYICIANNVEFKDAYNYVKDFSVELKIENGTQRVLVQGEDVTDFLRTPEVSAGASKVSAIPEIRSFLFDLQRNIAEKNDVIMDGRDIGTVILPDAEIKIFLTASPEVRAKRRFAELQLKENCPPYEEILADINKRDFDDTHRETAPLKPAEDSIFVDTSDLNEEESILFLSRIFSDFINNSNSRD
jgi:cytidylate kinase